MAERPEDLNLPITVVQRLVKEAVINNFQFDLMIFDK